MSGFQQRQLSELSPFHSVPADQEKKKELLSNLATLTLPTNATKRGVLKGEGEEGAQFINLAVHKICPLKTIVHILKRYEPAKRLAMLHASNYGDFPATPIHSEKPCAKCTR